MGLFDAWVGNWKRAAGSVINAFDDMMNDIDKADSSFYNLLADIDIGRNIVNESYSINNYKEKVLNAIGVNADNVKNEYDLVCSVFAVKKNDYITFLSDKYGISKGEVRNKLNMGTNGTGVGACLLHYFSGNKDMLIAIKKMLVYKYNVKINQGQCFWSFASDFKHDNGIKGTKNIW